MLTAHNEFFLPPERHPADHGARDRRDRGQALLHRARHRHPRHRAARSSPTCSAAGARRAASTITEQFVKNALGQQYHRTLLEKFKEAAIAFQLAHRWSKDQILADYLDTAYFGSGAYGVEAAARAYFGSDPESNLYGCGTRAEPQGPRQPVRDEPHRPTRPRCSRRSSTRRPTSTACRTRSSRRIAATSCCARWPPRATSPRRSCTSALQASLPPAEYVRSPNQAELRLERRLLRQLGREHADPAPRVRHQQQGQGRLHRRLPDRHDAQQPAPGGGADDRQADAAAAHRGPRRRARRDRQRHRRRSARWSAATTTTRTPSTSPRRASASRARRGRSSTSRRRSSTGSRANTTELSKSWTYRDANPAYGPFTIKNDEDGYYGVPIPLWEALAVSDNSGLRARRAEPVAWARGWSPTTPTTWASRRRSRSTRRW